MKIGLEVVYMKKVIAMFLPLFAFTCVLLFMMKSPNLDGLLFVYTYENHAWSDVEQRYEIYADGKIKYFSNTNGEIKNIKSQMDIDDLTKFKDLASKVGEDIIDVNSVKLTGSNSLLALQLHKAADSGVTTYKVYNNGKWINILHFEENDIPKYNDDLGGHELVNFFMGIKNKYTV